MGFSMFSPDGGDAAHGRGDRPGWHAHRGGLAADGTVGRRRNGAGIRPDAGRRGGQERCGRSDVEGNRGADRLGSPDPRPGRAAIAAGPEAAIDLDPGGRGNPTVVVGLGGSATTDGGLGALEAIEEAGGLGGLQLVGACDVEVGFVEAARRFAPQKGADRAQVAALEVRLDGLASHYQREFGVDVRTVAGAGAAGGFGGAIVALGGRLLSGYRVVTELLGFAEVLRTSQVVVTGEGAFDATSLLGKVVGSVLADASESGVPALVIAGRVERDASEVARASGARVVSLSERFGEERARADTVRCIELSVAEHLSAGGLSGL